MVFCGAAGRAVCCCPSRLLLLVLCCFVRAGWCCVFLPVNARCSLLGLVARCCFPRYMEKTRKREVAGPRAWRVRKIFLGFYAQLAKSFSLLIWRVRGRGARRSTPTFTTVLTAFTIHPFMAEGVGGEDAVELPPLELPLRHE